MEPIGFFGLGRMGYNIVLNLRDKNVPVIATNRSHEPIDKIKEEGVEVGYSPEEVVGKLGERKIIWVMVTAGDPVDKVIDSFLPHLKKGDIVIDGGNSYWKNSLARYERLKEKGIHFLDCGTSGGLTGARNGACLTIGGDKETFEEFEWIFKAVACENGYLYTGSHGSGHFVKMVHNGIEYALLAAYGEGFHILHESRYKDELDFEQISRVWSNGSVIRSWLTELAQDAFGKDAKLDAIQGVVGGGQTGTWSQEAAREVNVPTRMLDTALELRKDSQENPNFSGQVVAALRNEFGGHAVVKKE